MTKLTIPSKGHEGTEVELANQTTLVLYSSIKDMPIRNYNLLQKFLSQDIGIGSDMDSVNAHFARLDQFLSTGDLENAKAERNNLHYNFFMMLNEISITSRSFLCMIATVNGTPVGNIEDDVVAEELLQRLAAAGLTVGDVEQQLDVLKKKSSLS